MRARALDCVCSVSAKVMGIDIEVNTRAKSIQPHKFDTIKITVMPEETMETVRNNIFGMIHSAKDYSMDVLKECVFKTPAGNKVTIEYDQMRLGDFMEVLGIKPPLILNMVLDGYGEGGGKRAKTSVCVHSDFIAKAIYCDLID